MIDHRTKSNFMTVVAALLLLYIFTPLGDVVNGFLVNGGYIAEVGNERGPLSQELPVQQMVQPTAEYRISPTEVPAPNVHPQQFEGTVPVNNPVMEASIQGDDRQDGQRSGGNERESMGASLSLPESNGTGNNRILFWRDTNENCMIDSDEQSPNFMLSIISSTGQEQKVVTDNSGSIWANEGDYISFVSNGFYLSPDAVSNNLDVYSLSRIQGTYYVNISYDATYKGRCE